MNPLKRIQVDPRYCGPRDSANGGYLCGLLAAHLLPVAEITLRRPPPLGREMEVRGALSQVSLHDAGDLVAEGRSVAIEIDVPAPPTFEAATEASKGYRGWDQHPLPHCFVCGPLRDDGMRIFAGSVPGTNLVASPWVPAAALDDGAGRVGSEFLWAALDCPGAFAIEGNVKRLLGRMTARIDGTMRIGEPGVVIGWHIETQGRKSQAGTALFADGGRLIGRSLAVWIAVDGGRAQDRPAP